MHRSYRRCVKKRVHGTHNPERDIQSRQRDNRTKMGDGIDFSSLVVHSQRASGEIENGRPDNEEKGTRDTRPEGLHML